MLSRTHIQCLQGRETLPWLRYRANTVPATISNAHFSYMDPTTGFGTWNSQPIGEVGAEVDEDPILCHFSVSHFATRRSPRVSIKLAGIPYPFLVDTGAELSVLLSYILSQLLPHYFGNTPRTRYVRGFAGRGVVNKGPYPLQIEVCGVKFVHPFYTLDSPSPCVAGCDLICAAKLVIDLVRQLVWSYWHVDLYATPPQGNLPSLHSVSADTSSTFVSPADKWLADCFRLVGLDPTIVESPSIDPPSPPALL